MRKYLLPTLILFVFASSTFSQGKTDLEKKYVNETIYRFGGTFRKGGEKLSFRDLQNEFSASPTGLDFYMEAKKNRTTGAIFRSLSFVASLVTVILIDRNPSLNTSLIGIGSQLVLSSIGGHYMHMSSEQVDQALWQRNKDVLFPPGSSQ